MQSWIKRYIKAWGYTLCDEEMECVVLDNGMTIDVEKPEDSISIYHTVYEDPETGEQYDYETLLKAANILNDGYVWHTKFYVDEELNDVTATLEFDFGRIYDMEFKLHKSILILERLPEIFKKVVELVKKDEDIYPKDIWGWINDMNLEVYAKLMAGKKLLYIHGFASSGDSGTAAEIQQLLPDTKVYSPDLPIDPNEAYEMLCKLVDDEEIDVVVGTSMGGMFANLINSVPTVLVNPSFHVSQSMRKKIGIVPFFKKRADGSTEFEVTEELCDAYEKVEHRQFNFFHERDTGPTYALFGDDDDVINCKDEYKKYYGMRYMTFHGGHRLTSDAIRNALLPAIVEIVRDE
ncbi:MAG: hypothetical protein NC036_01355 [Muribaculaceae bacterium]|nr:hypothetical protein [Muribaculaceae bacterium]